MGVMIMEMFSALMDDLSLNTKITTAKGLKVPLADLVLYLIPINRSCQIRTQHKKKRKNPHKNA